MPMHKYFCNHDIHVLRISVNNVKNVNVKFLLTSM